MTFTTLNTHLGPLKPDFSPPLSKVEECATREIVDAIAPTPPASPNALALAATTPAKALPPRQLLPTPVLHPDKPSLKLGWMCIWNSSWPLLSAITPPSSPPSDAAAEPVDDETLEEIETEETEA